MLLQVLRAHSTKRCVYSSWKRCFCEDKKVPDGSEEEEIKKEDTAVKKRLFNILSDMTAVKPSMKASKSKSSPETEKRVDEPMKMGEANVKSEVITPPPPPTRTDHVPSPLTKKLFALSESKESTASSIERKDVREVIEGMVIDREKQHPVKQSSFPVKTRMRTVTRQEIDIFSQEPLNVFLSEGTTEIKQLHVWEKLEKKELETAVSFAPLNAFEEIIQWTKKGKYWTFPIDNETGLEHEEKFGFHDHVFLERHLNKFPKKGPIRHFMELVAVGLSKNPYISVDRKLQNIEWFEEYFKQKEDILKEYGVLDKK